MSSDFWKSRWNVLTVMVGRNGGLPVWAFVVPVMGVLFAEAALFYTHTEYALLIHLLNLLFCVFIPLRHQETLALLQPFALLPLFRLVNLGMPIFFELTLFLFPFIYLPLLPALYLVVRSQDIRIGVNARAFLIGLLPVVLLSIPLAIVEFAIISPAALIPEPSIRWFLAISVIMVFSVGLVEEVLFRGILQRRLIAFIGRWQGIVLTSVIFASMHSIYGSWLEILYVTFLGIVFGSIYEWSDSIGLVIFLHAYLNVFLFAVIPLYLPNVAVDILPFVSTGLI